MPITVAEFGVFFEQKKNGTYKCSFCGNEQFMPTAAVFHGTEGALPPYSPDAPMGFHTIPVGRDKTDIPLGAHAYYGLACTNCGRTDFFHSRLVDQWMTLYRASIAEKAGSPTAALVESPADAG